MTLADYLRTKAITLTAFAAAIDVSVESVSRYRDGERIPLPRIMERIKVATGNAVMPNDFYPSEPAPALDERSVA